MFSSYAMIYCLDSPHDREGGESSRMVLCKIIFWRGALRGLEQATREISRGISSHYELEGQIIPERVAKAIRLSSRLRRSLDKWATDRRIRITRNFGSAGIRRKAPAEGKIRVDLSLTELLQLSWLAHWLPTHDAELPWIRNPSVQR
jgi:hypothetical protein